MTKEYRSKSELSQRPPSETRRKTLEEIAAAFGDKVVVLTDAERSSRTGAVDSVFKTDAEEVEAAYTGASSHRE